MIDTTETAIKSLISQSDEIAKEVRQENWDTVELLTNERQQALEKFFSKPITAKHANSVEKMIRKLLGSDQEVIQYIESEKQKTFNNYANLQNNNKANQAYKNVASLNFS